MPIQARAILVSFLLMIGLAAHALPGEAGSLGEDAVPTVDEAFGVSATVDPDSESILVDFRVLEHCYLYRHRFGFLLESPDGAKITDFPNLELPTGEKKIDEIFGEVHVFHEDLTVSLPLDSVPAGQLPQQAVLVVDYQGCLEDQLCYPPETRRFELDLSVLPGTVDTGEPAGPENSAAGSPPTNDASGATDDDGFFSTLRSQDANAFNVWMQGHGLGMVVLLFFAGGLLLAFTPCVFPMIPILSGIIAGEDNPSAHRGFVLSISYVLGVAVPYTLAGLLVAVFGAELNLQYWLQQPAAIIIAAVIFVLLSLAMFGLYELQLPAFLRDRLHRHSEKTGGGSLLGAGLMGAISALIVSPCVTPILAGALVYVAGTGDALTGASSLFALAIGMGVPLILVGTGGGSLLPRAGGWMDDIKHLFGVLMLGIAIWLLDRIIPDGVTLALYGILLAVYGVQLGALEPGGEYRLRRGIALILALYGAIMLVGAASGGSDPWQPLSHMGGGSSAEASAPQSAEPADGWEHLRGQATLEQAMAEARRADRPVLVDFYAEWCVACRVLSEETLTHPAVLDAMSGFRLLQVDITDVTPANRAMMKDYNVLGLPTLVFFGPDGEEIPDSRVLGEMDHERFLKHLNRKVFPAI